MLIDILSKEQFLTSLWSGGSTTQIAIFPEQASYAQRDFLWRISSATVDQDESTFTTLPDYDRIISVLHGQMTLSHAGQPPICLSRLDLHSFDGGIKTVSQGKCTDFNLMTRKDRCQGQVVCHRISPLTSIQINMNPPFADFDHCRFALFLSDSTLFLYQNDQKKSPHLLQEGSLTFVHDGNGNSITLHNPTSALICFFQIDIGW